MDSKFCQVCNDGKTKGEVWTIFGQLPKVLCPTCKDLISSAICDIPENRRHYEETLLPDYKIKMKVKEE